MNTLFEWLFSPLKEHDKKVILREALILESDASEVTRGIGKFIKRVCIFREKIGGSVVPLNPYDTDRYNIEQEKYP